MMMMIIIIMEIVEVQLRGSPKHECTHTLLSSGIAVRKDEDMFFVGEIGTLCELSASLLQQCLCGNQCWMMTGDIRQFGHVLRTEYECQSCGSKKWWASSRITSDCYVVNQKCVHAFTCAGICPTQYINFCTFSGIGTLGKRYIASIYKSKKYIDVIKSCVDTSMRKAVNDIKALPSYTSSGGEWVITDARHDSTANAYHTTVPCLSGSTHKIVGCVTVTLSRNDHIVAQTRELECTKEVLPRVINRVNLISLKILEVAHDNCKPVKKLIEIDFQMTNSFDTWHGTKNVAKSMTKIAVGSRRNAGKTWFPELSDKRKSTKVHLYYCMKNCAKSPDKLRASIMNIVDHYKGCHANCDIQSPCQRPGYRPSKIQLTDPTTIAAYTTMLQSTLIYKEAPSYCRCRDTFWVESFNHQLLSYLPKRIHFGTVTFVMRMNLACLDWNENVGRAATSEYITQDMRRPDRRTPMKVLIGKTYHFVVEIWEVYLQQHASEARTLIGEQEVLYDDIEDDDVDLLDDGVGVEEHDMEEEDMFMSKMSSKYFLEAAITLLKGKFNFKRNIIFIWHACGVWITPSNFLELQYSITSLGSYGVVRSDFLERLYLLVRLVTLGAAAPLSHEWACRVIHGHCKQCGHDVESMTSP